jgi:methylated-DNA-[protein]-cysteine S-methyltransferase
MTELAWGRVESPLGGPLHVGVSPVGLARIRLPSEQHEHEELGDDEALVAVRRQLEEYFAGERRVFTMPLDLSAARGFRLRALEAMGRVPYGETVTYSELAARAGNPRAARAAGHTCATNPIPIVLPCHRILGRDGGLHGFTGGIHLKEQLLRLEGVL